MSYSGFANYYDNLTKNVDYKKLADYIESILSKFSHKSGIVLDLACGTGSLTLELSNRGFDIYGADSSPSMLSVAHQKAADADKHILFLCQKMQELDLFGTIDTCICCLDSINHVTTEKDIQKAFDRVSLFMNKGGYFIFDCNTVYKHREILSNNSFVYDTPAVFCVWQNTLLQQDIIRIDLDFFEPLENGQYIRSSEHFTERAYSLETLSSMLEKSGFCIDGIFGEYTMEAPLPNTQRVFFVARKEQ